ncbi:MAG: hypothetical protein QOJ99_1748 [Bryobacterales bacterium]|nr:hypothetical protein [Bryobacterales bacterium]
MAGGPVSVRIADDTTESAGFVVRWAVLARYAVRAGEVANFPETHGDRRSTFWRQRELRHESRSDLQGGRYPVRLPNRLNFVTCLYRRIL